MVKIHSAIPLLFELCNFRLTRVFNNPCDSTGMLNVDEGVVLVDNKSKILQIQNVRFIPAFFSSNARTAFLFQSASPAFLNHASQCTYSAYSRTWFSHFFNSKRETRVLRQTQPTLEVRISIPREVYVSTNKHEIRIQNGMYLRHKEPKSPHPHGVWASSSDIPATDLRDYLTKKRSVHQITPQCHCEKLITAAFFDCHCSFQITMPLVFNWLSAA